MVIDTHVRPALYEPICRDGERFQKRCDAMNYHLMKPAGLALLKKQYALAGIEGVFLLPSDCSFEEGQSEISNDEIASLVAMDPDYFYGFATVDPRNTNAVQELVEAFTELRLRGLYLNTARLHLYPDAKEMWKIYDVCREYGKPILFHTGFCLEKDAFAKYARPMDLEAVIAAYPEVNFCLAHLGWPWVQETAALLLKYPNAYANTALMNFDGPYQIYRKVLLEDMGSLWVEHNLSDKLMFGSDSPRIRPVRSKRGLDSLGFTQETTEKIEYRNALRFLGIEKEEL